MRIRRARHVGLLLAALLFLGGCVTRVVPPGDVREPAKVFILDHGRHTSLVVSTPEGGLVRYAYGDWRFYAERETGLGHAIAASFWNTPGALGRRHLPGPPDSASVRRQVPFVIETLHEIEVEQARLADLRAELDAIFATAERELETPSADLVFVPHPRDYNLRHNSNTAIAAWLVKLGCETKGPAILARWRIDPPTTGATP